MFICLFTGETAVSSWARNSCDAQQWQTCSMWWHGWRHCFERFSNNEDWAHHRCPSRYFNISFMCASVEGCGSCDFFGGWAIDELESCKNALVFWPVQLILSNRPSGVCLPFPGKVSSLDLKGDLLVSCGLTMRMGRVYCEPFIKVWLVLFLFMFQDLTTSSKESFCQSRVQ